MGHDAYDEAMRNRKYNPPGSDTMPSKSKLKVKRIKEQQYAKDEKAATDFMERSVMCAEVTLPGPVARSIARYISNLQQESDNDLSGIIAMSEELMKTSGQLVEQNAKYKADLAAMTERYNQMVADMANGAETATNLAACRMEGERDAARTEADALRKEVDALKARKV